QRNNNTFPQRKRAKYQRCVTSRYLALLYLIYYPLFGTCQHQSRIAVIQFVNGSLRIAVVTISSTVPTGIVQLNFTVSVFNIQLEIRHPGFLYAIPLESFLARHTVLTVISVSVAEVTEKVSVLI